jgi:hypothetical protein
MLAFDAHLTAEFGCKADRRRSRPTYAHSRSEIVMVASRVQREHQYLMAVGRTAEVSAAMRHRTLTPQLGAR